jgi:hypothetical protein
VPGGAGPITARVGVAGMLAAAWILVVVVWSAAGEDLPTAGLAGVAAVCALGGAAAWVLAPGHRRARFGALGGILVFATFVLLAIGASAASGTLLVSGEGETPFSTLIELPFWLGVPLVVSACCGAAGWHVARVLGSRSASGDRGPSG